jgi:hypothetical protein
MPAGTEEKKDGDACDEGQADKPHLRLRRTNGCAQQPERRVTEPHSHDTPFTSPNACAAATGVSAAQRGRLAHAEKAFSAQLRGKRKIATPCDKAQPKIPACEQPAQRRLTDRRRRNDDG